MKNIFYFGSAVRFRHRLSLL